MATITATTSSSYGLDMVAFSNLGGYDDSDNVTIANSSQMRITGYEPYFQTSYTDNWYGVGFNINTSTYAVTAGTLTGFSKALTGIGTVSVSNLNLSAATAYQYLQTYNNVAGLMSIMLGGNDTLTGSSTSDVLKGYAGNDAIGGGGGSDEAVFSGDFANYTITTTSSGFTVIDNIGADGTDSLTSIEYLRFADQTVATSSLGSSADSNGAIAGSSGNDTLTGGAGKSIDGGSGIDTVTYTTNPAITYNSDGTWDVGSDTLSNIERLQLASKRIALDVSPNANAGNAMEFIGVVAPGFLNNLAVRGTIISLFDTGNTMDSLAALALQYNLLPTSSSAVLANQVCLNVLDSLPSQALLDSLVAYIDTNGQAKFVADVANLGISVDLVAFQQTGLEYA